MPPTFPINQLTLFLETSLVSRRAASSRASITLSATFLRSSDLTGHQVQSIMFGFSIWWTPLLVLVVGVLASTFVTKIS